MAAQGDQWRFDDERRGFGPRRSRDRGPESFCNSSHYRQAVDEMLQHSFYLHGFVFCAVMKTGATFLYACLA